jgi:flavin reductase (DIM6/NTAB) family NADH-FMN oxidoreductase RutF
MIGTRFAAKLDAPFEGVKCRPGLIGGPIITGVAAYFECSAISEFDVGTHTIFIGQVWNGDVSEARPLIYHGGAYTSLSTYA